MKNIYLKKELEDVINSFSGDFREVFIENSSNIRLTMLNGNLKTPTIGTDFGVSILGRVGKKEYFKVYNIDLDIENIVSDFKKEYGLFDSKNKVSLEGQEYLSFDSKDFVSIIEKIEIVNKLFKDTIKEETIIVSSEMFLGINYKDFIVANSTGVFRKDFLSYNSFYIRLVGEKEGSKEEIFEKITGIDILDKINEKELKKLFEKTIYNLKEQLSSHRAPAGDMDVIIGNEAGGTIIHEAVGHGLEGDLQAFSVYSGKIGEKVAGDNITIVDDPTICNHRGFYNYDHEGSEAKKTILIENGILKTYMHNLKTAQKFSTNSTAHGRKEAYKYKSLVRMGITYLAPGKDKKEDLISKVKSGVYVSSMGGGQVNTTNGDFVFEIKSGYIIKDGKLDKKIKGATLSGNGPKMLNEIYGVCDDMNFIDGGTCGKGQAMSVSDACPTILTKLRVSPI